MWVIFYLRQDPKLVKEDPCFQYWLHNSLLTMGSIHFSSSPSLSLEKSRRCHLVLWALGLHLKCSVMLATVWVSPTSIGAHKEEQQWGIILGPDWRPGALDPNAWQATNIPRL